MPHPNPAPADAALKALRSRVEGAERRIEAARVRGPYAAAAVTMVIVTKSVPGTMLPLVAALPRRDIGENRVLDAAVKRESAPRGLVWHGIGHLQTNKAKKAIATFDVFHAARFAPPRRGARAAARRCEPSLARLRAGERGARPEKARGRRPRTRSPSCATSPASPTSTSWAS